MKNERGQADGRTGGAVAKILCVPSWSTCLPAGRLCATLWLIFFTAEAQRRRGISYTQEVASSRCAGLAMTTKGVAKGDCFVATLLANFITKSSQFLLRGTQSRSNLLIYTTTLVIATSPAQRDEETTSGPVVKGKDNFSSISLSSIILSILLYLPISISLRWRIFFSLTFLLPRTHEGQTHLRPVVFQHYIYVVPEFIVRNTSRTLRVKKDEFLKLLKRVSPSGLRK